MEKNDYRIIQNMENSLYTILFDYYDRKSREILIKSITKTKIILGATITNDYKSLSFNTNFINKYTKKSINYDTLLIMTYHLSIQLKYLIDNNYTFIGYSPKNVIAIDNKFIYLPNSEEILSIENEKITITFPFTQQDFFLSPEMFLIKKIPSKIHYKTSYYSLACLLIYYLRPGEKEIMFDKLAIKGTKMYFLLERCLNSNIESRSILYI
jgi:hypothetical protein